MELLKNADDEYCNVFKAYRLLYWRFLPRPSIRTTLAYDTIKAMKKYLKYLNPKTWNDTTKYIIYSMLFLAIMAILLTWFLEFYYFINDFEKTWDFVFGRPVVFLFNSFLMWLILLFIWAICGRPILTSGICFAIVVIIGFIHVAKYNSRGYPLLPEDFQLASEAASLTKFVDGGSIIRQISFIIFGEIALFAFSYFCGKKFHLHYHGDKNKNVFLRHLGIARSIIILSSICVFLLSTNFARHNNNKHGEETFLGTTFTAWNQNENYTDNGFIIGFLYNLQKLSLREPDEYSEARIASIKEEYSNIAEAENKKRKDPSNEDVNVVVILNESFFDMDMEFQGKKFSDYYKVEGGDVTPELHKLQKSTPSGWMYSLDYGGGTANIEFEMLTSMSIFWISTTPYTALIPKAGEMPSIAQMLKKSGYSTTAIHPFVGGMYKRNIVLKDEGFDSFITSDEMDYTGHDGSSEYINDRSAYNQVLKTLKDSDEKQMIGLITMQNHTPYNPSTYERQDFHISTSEEISDDRKQSIETYLQTLHESDKYLGEFISNLKSLDEKVVVLFFGDHSPGLFEIVNSNDDKEVRDLSRVTPYFVWANYDAEFDKNKQLTTTSPNCMTNTMLNMLNWQKSPLYYLVDNVCKEQPILALTYFDGSTFESSKTLQDYELVIYDLLGGKKFWMNN